jgi:hypothetical protein
MLTISKDQMNTLSKVQEERFVKKLVHYTREEFPDETMNIADEDLNAICSQAISKTRGYGITEKTDICRFLNFMFIYGFEFDAELLWAKKILSASYHRSGTITMLELYETAQFIGNKASLS